MNQESPAEIAVTRLDRADDQQLRFKIGQWLENSAPRELQGRLASINRPSGEAGMSGDTFIISVDTASGPDDIREFVVRAELGATICPESSFDKMVGLQQKLGDMPDLPVPRVLHLEEDSSVIGGPFYVMEFIDGIVAPDSPPYTTRGWVCDASDEQRRALCESAIRFIVKLHGLNWQSLGLNFLRRTGEGRNETERHLNDLIGIYDNAMEGCREPLADNTISWLQNNLPIEESIGISWGDCRPGNGLWRDFELVAALDWEMCGLASPGLDVGLWLFSEAAFTRGIGVKPLRGSYGRNEFVDRYQAVAGKELEHFAYYEIFSAFRGYTIIVDMMKLYERRGQHMFGPDITTQNFPHAFILQNLVSRL